jgi:hypothetical protein
VNKVSGALQSFEFAKQILARGVLIQGKIIEKSAFSGGVCDGHVFSQNRLKAGANHVDWPQRRGKPISEKICVIRG